MEVNTKVEVMKWISEVLRHENFYSLEFEFPEHDSSEGYIADMMFVTISGIKNGATKKLDLVVKSGKILPEDTYTEVYVNEVNMYTKIIPSIQKFAMERNLAPFNNIPFCYGTLPANNRYVIILENIKIKGFKLHDVGKPLDINHTRKALEVIARWHAHSFVLKDQTPKLFETLTKYLVEIEENKLVKDLTDEYINEMESVIDFYKNKNKFNVIEKLHWFKENYRQIIKDALRNTEENYVVITHGDCWNNNILYNYKNTEGIPDQVVLIDWQLASKASPLLDVTQLLFYCCSRKELDHIDDLLQFYHNSLSQKMVELGSDPENCFPWDVCQSSFSRYVPLGLIAMPSFAKFGFIAENSTENESGDSNSVQKVKLTDPEAYFKRINDVYEFCIERGYL